MNPLRYVQEAWKLYQTENQTDTYIALLLVLVAVSPFLIRLYRQRFD